MRILTVVTAALVAGSISFAAMAGTVSPRGNVTEAAVVRTPLFASPEPRKTRESGKVRGAQKSAGRHKVTKATAVSRGGKHRRRGGGRRERIVIDTTTTASIPGKPFAARPASSRYDLFVSRYAASNGVPVALAHAVIRVESNYRPDARGNAGEVGLMQIKPATARMMGYRGSIKGLYDPETNIKYGMMYLGMAHRLGGGATCTTILKYNAGHAARRMNPVSSAYCGKVKRDLAGL